MSTFATVAALAVLTTVGLVGATVAGPPASVIWAVGTIVVAAALAYRLRRAPAGATLIAVFATGIAIVSAGLPAALVIGELNAQSSPAVGARPGTPPGAGTTKAAADPSPELRRALTRADEILPGGSTSLLRLDIRDDSTHLWVLDPTKGQSVYSSYSASSGTWFAPSRSRVSDRADATFTASDIAGLDLTAAAKKAVAAADSLGVDRSSTYASDAIVIGRRSGDKRLVETFSMSGFAVEADPAGNLPDNLGLAKVDGFLPAAERLLRANGIDPAQRVLSEVRYRAFAASASAVGSGDPGTVDIRLAGVGRGGTLTETVGRFPVVNLSPSSGSGTRAFALTTITPAGIEKARADIERRFSVPPVDAQAVSLDVAGDTSSDGWMTGTLPPLMQLGLGPSSKQAAYFRPDGTFVRTGP